jgi:hypothetical protein
MVASDKEFRQHKDQDFMDVDEGSQIQQPTEISQSLVDAIWMQNSRLDQTEAEQFHSKINAVLQ